MNCAIFFKLIVSAVKICKQIYTIGAIAEEADKLLFKKVMSANHCIRFCCSLLSPVGIALELKDIHMSSPDVNMNYIKSLLFHDVSIQIVTVKQSALSLFSFLKFGCM